MEEYDQEIVEELENNISEISTILDKWETFFSTDKMAHLTTLMRHAHTIKSVASFMGNEEIQSEAHTLEDKIAGINSVEEITQKLPEEIRNHLNIIKKLTGGAPLKKAFSSAENKESINTKSSSFSSLSEISLEHEKMLIERAFRSGEELYRLECRLDSVEALPYARAYLINRNLEEAGTVLRTIPSLKNKSSDFSLFTLFFTTDLKEKDIKKELQIDSVEKILLTQLDITTYNPGDILDSEETVTPSKSLDSESVLVSMDKLHDIEVNLEELILLNEQIELSEPIQYRKIKNVLDNLSKIVSGVVSIDLRSLLGDWHRFVSDVGARLSKDVILDLRCESIEISKNRTILIESFLRQLVHNSISHGIESPQERKEAGKNSQALIKIGCKSERGNLIIEYSDDGEGINQEALRKKGVKKGIISSDSDLSLLEILALPGLSSKDQVDYISGRGAGMDIVVSTIQESLGGSILLENKEGQGVSFIISLPLKDTHYDVLIFQSGELFLSLPKENIETTFSLEEKNVEEESPGHFVYWIEDQKLSIYNESGLISGDPLKYKFGILVRNGFHRAVVVADDLVMEKRLDSAQFTKCAIEESYIYDIKDGDNSFGYKFLSPLMIQR